MPVEVDIWAEVVGQQDAVELLRRSADDPVHAYMFLGPRGSGRWAAAKAFAAALLSTELDGESSERAVDLALRGQHPDLLRIQPTGTEYRKEEVDFLITEASRTPVEGARKVIVADRFHTANATSIGRLLKTLEEPPPSTIIVLLSEELPDEQVTIASRCLVVPFQVVPILVVEDWLSSQGLSSDLVETVALASGGDLQRARDLAGDEHVVERFDAWRSVLGGLDGAGAAVAIVVEELRSLIDEAQESIDDRHKDELEVLAEREEQLGTRGSGRTDLVAAQKREVRRMRTDELRFGLATLARVVRERMGDDPRKADVAALNAIRDANEALTRNPNEALLL
ncbi:MAG: hypothetical protein ACR2PK_01895, partial [Acidimicrobiales bacterium]